MMGSKRRDQLTRRSRSRRNRIRGELLERRLLLAAGDADLSFGLDGAVSVPIVSAAHTLKPVVIAEAPGDKTIVVLETNTKRNARSSSTVLVARFNDDGSPDETFADIGTRELLNRNRNGEDERVVDAVLDDQGNIYVLGEIGDEDGHPSDIAVSKFGPDGSISPDLSGLNYEGEFYDFGSNTLVVDRPAAIDIDDEGNLYVASVSGGQSVVARIRPNGDLDDTFGTDGIALIQPRETQTYVISDLRVLGDGSIITAGLLDNLPTAVGLDSVGAIDSSFGNAGTTTFDGHTATTPPRLHLEASGRALIGATVGGNLVVGAVMSGGGIDSSFGTAGATTIDPGGTDKLVSIKTDSDGKILLSGISIVSNDASVVVARLNANGSPDATVGSGGILTRDLGTTNDLVGDILPTDAGGVILATGQPTSTLGFGTASLISLDNSFQDVASFGIGGTAPIEAFVEEEVGIAHRGGTKALADDSMLIVGSTHAVKLLEDGTLDPSYGVNGISKQSVSFSGGKVLFRDDGSYIVASRRDIGSGTYGFFAVDENGELDANFGNSGVKTESFEQAVFFADALAAPDGGFYVIGNTFLSQGADPEEVGIVVTKYDSVGARDTNFATDGELLFNIPDAEISGSRLFFDDSGDLVVVGVKNIAYQIYEVIFAGVTHDGQINTAFGDQGIVSSGFTVPGIRQAARIDNGDFVVTTEVNDVTTIHRLNAAGELIRTFGFNGSISLDDPTINSTQFSGELIIDERGGILAATSSAESFFGVLRLTPEGKIDPLFGDFGVASVPLAADVDFNSFRAGLDFDSQGRIVAGVGVDFNVLFDSRLTAFRFENTESNCGTAGCIRLQESFPDVEESAGETIITLVREGGSSGEVSVRLRTLRERTQEAFPDEDYTPVDNRVTFADGQTAATVVIPIVADDIDEAPDTILIEIDDARGGAVFENPQRARLTILRQGLNPVALDSTFGAGGFSDVALGGEFPPIISDVLQQPDGKIVAVGRDNQPPFDFLTLRLDADGSLDDTFSDDGIVRTDFQLESDSAEAVGIQSDGKLIVVGSSRFSSDVGLSESRATLLRLLPNGKIDPSFGPQRNGRIVSDNPEPRTYTDVLVASDDSMFVASEVFRTDDETFERIRAVIVQRLFSDGSVDPNFGNAGSVRIDGVFAAGQGKQIALDGNGRLLVLASLVEEIEFDGRMIEVGRPAVVAMSQAGALDRGFGNQGVRAIRELGNAGGSGLVIDEAGRIVLAVVRGSLPDSFDKTRLAVVRLLPDGQFDGSFDGDGIALMEPLGNDHTRVTDITITPNGRIWVLASFEAFSTFGDIGLVSFLPNGRLDPAINGVGYEVFPIANADSRSGAMTVLAGGEVLVATARTRFEPGSPFEQLVTLIKARGSDGAGQFDLEFDKVDVDENRSVVELQVLRTDGGQGAVTVSYATRNGEARAGEDFEMRSGELLFQDGQTVARLEVPLIDNDLQEGREAFFVDLAAPTGGAILGARSTAEVTIVDGPGQIEFASPTILAAESQRFVSMRLTRHDGSDGEVSVRVRSTGGTATIGADYFQLDQVVTFADAQREASVNLLLLDDPVTEGVETVDLRIDDPTGGVIIGTQSTATLRLFDVEPFQATTAGAFDLSFSDDGRARPVRPPGVEPDSSFFFGPEVNPIGMANTTGGSFVVADQFFRLTGVLADGNVNRNFGNEGVAEAIVDSQGADSQRAEAFAVDHQGRFLLAGRRSLGFESDFVVVRFGSNGGLDTTFGDGGIAVLDLGADDRAFALAVDGDNRAYVAGSTGGVFERQMVVIRLTESGAFDPNYADSGIRVLAADERFEEATALLAQADGSLLVAGHVVRELLDVPGLAVSSADIAVMRIDADGEIDTTYGDGGRTKEKFRDRTGNVTDDDRVRKLILLAGGQTLMIGSTDGEYLIARLNKDGSLDQTFGGGDGYTTGVLSPGDEGAEGLDFAHDAILGVDGAITVIGESRSAFGGEQLSVARLDASGIPDPTFGARGGRLFAGLDFADGGRAVIRAQGGGLLVATLGGSVVKLIETTVCPAAGCVQFAELDASDDEFDRPINIRVSRPINASQGEVTVEYFTIDGSATGGVDYVTTSGTLTFGDSETSQFIEIPFIGDIEREGDETFYVVLAAPGGGAILGAQFVIPVVIEDNEFSPDVTLPFLSVRSGTFAEDAGTINARLSFDSIRRLPIELNYTTIASGTATPGVDYIPSAGTITIGVDDTEAFIPVPVILDDEIEPDETFRIVISGVTGARVSSATATITIVDVISTDCEGGPGTPHANFGDGGITRVDPDPDGTGDVGPVSTFLADDGRIVQVGSLQSDTSGISVVRYNADGTRDNTFGDGGIVRLETVQNGGVLVGQDSDEDGSEHAEAVRMLPDGRVLILGRGFFNNLFNMFVIRLNADGSLDATFGDQGFQFTPLSNLDVDFTSAKVAPDGSVYLSGEAGVQWRSNEDNRYQDVVFKDTFFPAGFRTTYRQSTMMLRVDPNGQLDRGFGFDGSVVFAGASGIRELEFDDQGRPLVLIDGFTTDESGDAETSIIRLNVDGSIDPAFAGGPYVPELPFPSDFVLPDGITDDLITNEANVRDLTVAPNGDLLLFGTLSQRVASPDNVFLPLFSAFDNFVFRVSSSLQPVTEFADQGVVRLDPSADFKISISDIAAQDDGRVLMFGRAFNQLAAIRLHPSGELDLGFGGTGLMRVPNTNPGGVIEILKATDDTTLISMRDTSQFTVVSLSSGPAVGVLRMARSIDSIREDGDSIELLIRRVCGVDGPVSVTVSTADGTAIAGQDYTSVNQVIDFADAEFEKTITVPIIDDEDFTGDLDFTINLSAAAGAATVGNVPTTTVTIIDDEQPGRLQFVAGPVSVIESDGNATVTIERIDGDGGEVTVLVTPAGTATAGEDFTFEPTTITFANGVTTQDIVISIEDDDVVEPDVEVIRLTLSDPGGGAELGFITTTTIDITDDDVMLRPPSGTFSISAESDSVNEFNGFATYTITRTNGSEGEVNVSYFASGVSATNNRDFRGGSGSVLFVDGQTTRSFVLPILDDTEIEGDEDFSVRLSFAGNGRVDPEANEVTTTILDDDLADVLLDLGDAPETFSTTLGVNGPRHVVVDGFTLGSTIDSEDDATPSDDASSDVGDDGIVGLDTAINAGRMASIEIAVSIPDDVNAGLVQGWIDFNGDGTFSEDERIVNNELFTSSETRSVGFLVPAFAMPGDTFARFRLSSLASLSPVGNAPDGEVEDYPLTIDAIASTPRITAAKNARLAIDNDNDGRVDPGDTIRYTVNVSNSGDAAANAVRLSDTPDANTTLVIGSVTTTQGTVAIGNASDDAMVIVDVGTLAAETGVATIVFDVMVNNPFPVDVTSVSNQGTITGIDFDTVVTGVATETIIDKPAGNADLTLSKSVNDVQPNVGDEVKFTVTLNNQGPDAATGIAVTDVLPPGLMFIGSSQQSYDLATGVWTVDLLPVGQPQTLTITALVTAPGASTNVARVTASDQPDPDAVDNEARVTMAPQVADLSLVKTVNNSAPLVGQDVTFTIALNNAGPDGATGVTVADQLPEGLEFVRATTVNGSYDEETGEWSIGDIDANSTATLDIVATLTSQQSVTNFVEVATSDQFDPDPDDNQFSVVIGACLTSGPLTVGMNRLVYSCVTPGGFANFVMGTRAGSHFFEKWEAKVDIADPGVPVIGVGNIDGVATVLVEISEEHLNQEVIFQAFEMLPNRKFSNTLTLKTSDDLVGIPLRSADVGNGGEALAASSLPALTTAAIARWEATGLSEADARLIRSLDVRISDLPGDQLAASHGNFVLVDGNAFGNGWFVDVTPSDDTEFSTDAVGERVATSPAATDRIDLLTVLMHEMGHVLGHDDVSDGSTSDLMSRTLPIGVRRLPTSTYDSLDVNRDGKVSALDALVIINQLAREQSLQQASGESLTGNLGQVLEVCDVNGDGRVSALDALDVINDLSRSTVATEAESEQGSMVDLMRPGRPVLSAQVDLLDDDDLIRMLADDNINARLSQS